MRRGEVAVASLDADERVVIAALCAQVDELVEANPFHEGSTESDDPAPHDSALHDPALRRLFPDAAPSDRKVSDEYRRLAEPDLRSLKVERLRRIRKDLSREGPEWAVSLEDALPTAAALTDVRLVIASRLGIETDEDAELLHGELDMAQGLLEHGAPEGLSVDQERVSFVMMYQALTWLQDSLVACVMDREGGDDE